MSNNKQKLLAVIISFIPVVLMSVVVCYFNLKSKQTHQSYSEYEACLSLGYNENDCAITFIPEELEKEKMRRHSILLNKQKVRNIMENNNDQQH